MTSSTSSSGRQDDDGRELPAGVYFIRGKPKPYLVRVGRGSPGETFAKFEQAVVRCDELREYRALGIRAASARAAERTLIDALDDLLARKRVSGRKGPLTERGLQHWERSCAFWREQRFARLPVRLLDVAAVEDAHLLRAGEAPTAARNEMEALKAALRYAATRGSQFALGLLEIQPLRVERGLKGQAMTLDQLDYLCAFAVEHQRRGLLLLGTVGPRVSELCGLLPEHVDLAGQALRLPAWLCKERRPKAIPLFAEEVRLLAEQLAVRPPEAERVFPRKGGTPWQREHYYHAVVVATRRRAAVAWRREHDLEPGAATPFEWTVVGSDGEEKTSGIAPHDFRRTAATALRDAGFTKEQAATRLGHSDDGELLDRLYDRGDRVQRARVAFEAHDGLHAALDPAGAGRGAALADTAPTSRPSRARHLRAVS